MKNKFLAVILTAMCLVCSTAFAGERFTQAFQDMMTQDTDTILGFLKQADLANDTYVHVNGLGNIACIKLLPALDPKDPVLALGPAKCQEAFLKANPALAPNANGWVLLENFLTLARAGKILPPLMPTAEQSAAAPVPSIPTASKDDVTAVQQEVSALQARIKAVEGKNAESVQLLSRLNVLKGQLEAARKEAGKQAEEAKAVIEAAVKANDLANNAGAGATFAAEVATTAGEQAITAARLANTAAGKADKATEAANLAAKGADIAAGTVTKAAKWMQVQIVGLAVAVALLLLVVYFVLRSRITANQDDVAAVKNRLVTIQEEQSSQQEDVVILKRKTEHLRDIEIDPHLVDKLNKLKGEAQYSTRMWVDKEEFRLTFRRSTEEGERNMFRVEGLQGQHNAFLAKNAPGILKRAGRDDRVLGIQLLPQKNEAEEELLDESMKNDAEEDARLDGAIPDSTFDEFFRQEAKEA